LLHHYLLKARLQKEGEHDVRNKRIDDMKAVLMHRAEKRQYAFLALMLAWAVAYLYSFGHRLIDDPILALCGVPGGLVFGWFLMPPNLFRVISGAEPSQALAWPLIIGYWAVLIPLQVSYLWSKLSLILILISALLLLSTHGCYQWVNDDAW
jgi:hypothetical protein